MEAKLIEAGDKLVVVEFFSTKCGPCKSSALLDQIAKERKNKLVLLKVNADEFEELTREYDIVLKPSFVFKRNGLNLDTLVGISKLREYIAKHLKDDEARRELEIMREKYTHQRKELVHLRKLQQKHEFEMDVLRCKLNVAESSLEKLNLPKADAHQCLQSERCQVEIDKLKDKFERKQQEHDHQIEMMSRQIEQLRLQQSQREKKAVENHLDPTTDYAAMFRQSAGVLHASRKAAEDVYRLYELGSKVGKR